MDREGFRNRLKQYKKAREENPGLKYWEWKAQPAEKVIPKYDEGVGMVGTPSAGMADFNKNLANLLSEATAKGFLNTVRRRLYDNLDPYNYSNLDLNERAQDRVINSVWKNKRDLQGLYYREGEYSTERDDIFAEYLNIPKENRHKIYNSLGEDISNEKHLVIPSKYKPSKTKNNNVEYKTIDKIKDKDIVSSLDYRYNDLNFNENATVRNNLGKYFGYYTVGRGLDPKRGEYISVYDLWDINPFYGDSGSDSEDGNWLDKVVHKKVGNEDASLGIGKPIEFYDRVYLNDYYGVDSKPDKGQYYGGYIPEVEIRPETYDDGGIPTYDEGGRVIPTQEEYITQQIDAKKAAALAAFRNATEPVLPIINGLPNVNSCIYTALNMYGKKYATPGNWTFYDDPGKYGFKRKELTEAQPSDLIQVLDKNKPYHMMMLDGYDEKGLPLYNYSRGVKGDSSDIVKAKTNFPNTKKLAYEFVGTPADSTQWKNEYKQLYGYADGGEVVDNDFMKQFGKQVSYKPEETSWWSDVKNWWNDLTGMKNYAYGNCATTPNGKHTGECAHYSNSVLRNRGYKNIIGDAWTRAANSGMKKITSGYDGLTKPTEWDESDAHDYLQSAANNFINNVDTTALNPYDVIGLYYPDSPNMKKAFEQGRWGETQTHTGHIAVGNDGTHYVVHNVGGHLKMNKLADMLTGDYDYLPVSAYRPKK